VRYNKIAPALAGAFPLPHPLSRRSSLPELAPCDTGHRLPGFVGPSPSATLDKSASYSIVMATLPYTPGVVNVFHDRPPFREGSRALAQDGEQSSTGSLQRKK